MTQRFKDHALVSCLRARIVASILALVMPVAPAGATVVYFSSQAAFQSATGATGWRRFRGDLRFVHETTLPRRA